ncbi:hypothetical protein V1291_000066 [Nitrobacteraceae bacterium AZCC 1564]
MIELGLGFSAGFAACWFGKDWLVSAYQTVAGFVAKIKGAL